MHRIICVLLLVPCLVAAPNSATADWAAVESLAAGERIQVELSTGKFVNGKIDHVTSESVFVQHGRQTTEVRRQEVNRLYRQKSGAGAKWAAIGALIGAGAGGGAGAAVLERESGFGGAMAGTVALGGALGAGVGYLLGRGKSVLVYKAPSQKR
jgi:hypothetical protein